MINGPGSNSTLTFSLEFGANTVRHQINHLSHGLASLQRIELALGLYRLATLGYHVPMELTLSDQIFMPGAIRKLFSPPYYYSLEDCDGRWELTVWLRHTSPEEASMSRRDVALWKLTTSVKERLDEVVHSLQKICPINDILEEVDATVGQSSTAA